MEISGHCFQKDANYWLSASRVLRYQNLGYLPGNARVKCFTSSATGITVRYDTLKETAMRTWLKIKIFMESC